MGTPEFAVPCLQAIKKSQHHLVAVITSPDKRGGRGRKKLLQSAVKKAALQWEIPILQPTNLKDKEFNTRLRSFQTDIQVVVAFRMLPEIVWNMPPLGTINLHASLLPDYRGAAPINWAIINGEQESGLTTFQLQQEIDTGDLLLQKSVTINPDDNAGDLHDRLMKLGPELVIETLNLLEAGDIQAQKQKPTKVPKKAPKLRKENTEIDFNSTVNDVYNFIRGLAPYPTAWTRLDGKSLKILDAKIYAETIPDISMQTGEVVIYNNKMLVQCKDGFLNILKLQLAGKRAMQIRDFLNGLQEPINRLG